MAIVRELWSGGQTGADQGALFGAEGFLPTGGWAAKGWLTEVGPAPWLARYGLREHTTGSYAARTVLNVRDTSGTLILGNPLSQGSRLTFSLCRRFKKPCLVIKWATERGPEPSAAGLEAVRAWLRSNEIERWHFAGNRESVNEGIEVAASRLVAGVLG